MTSSTNNTIYIVSFDGGGMKGYAQACFWEYMKPLLNNAPTIFAGTSIGGIQAIAYSYGETPSTMKTFFENDGVNIFNAKNLGVYVGRAGPTTWAATVASTQNSSIDNITDNSEVLYGYNTGHGQPYLYQRLTDILGDAKVSDLSTNTFITSFNVSQLEPVLFSNVELPDTRGKDFYLRDCAMATGAAPIYFKPHLIGSDYYIDGGMYENNPTITAYTMAKRLYPLAERYCILSIGTGLEKITYPNLLTQSTLIELRKLWEEKNILGNPATAPFYMIARLGEWLGISIAGGQEAVDKQLERIAFNPFENVFYLRFEYQMEEQYYGSLDNSDSAFLTYQQQQVNNFIADNEKKLDNFIKHWNS